jgi:hypothetical protein
MNVKETGREVVGWIHQAQGRDGWRVLNTVMNLQVPTGNLLTDLLSDCWLLKKESCMQLVYSVLNAWDGLLSCIRVYP